MPTLKPIKNPVSFGKELKALCATAAKMHKIRVGDEAIRHLRLTMNTVVASASLLPESIDVIYASLAERTKRRHGRKDVHEWLVDLPPADNEGSDDVKAGGEKQHHVRKLLTWKHEKRQTYYLVHWELTWGPRRHIHESVVTAFEKKRRLLVHKRFFEDEAVEDNTLKDTEG
ncbi:hypothetical protein PC128_g24522 [Phytophthora cactorum]|nr:hypothetical protein PC128_g24522 [Phytophthora cactorum]KAG4040235.1 hypothetical protein PC123_g24220 [Phytophthora cactorum]